MRKLSTQARVLTVFSAITAILLITLTGMALFLQRQAEEGRSEAIRIVEERDEQIAKLSEEVKTIKKKSFLLEEKNKEADERINSLLDELDLQEGLREEMKSEILSLKDQIESDKSARASLKDQLKKDLEKAEQKVVELEARLKVEENKIKELEKENQNLKASMSQASYNAPSGASETQALIDSKVDLETITVASGDKADSLEGRVLSVDQDTEFVIVDVGEKDGVEIGRILSIYRGKEYLGDIKITRIQPQMSAADLIPPLTSKTVRKNDQVVVR